ncbi:hypothetical protein CS0771_40660 [Catellatospora sp. IY07-71]|uniref:DNA-binding protein n=1 Tax=Catellatospora sp. IY07-71 TaxID=2728827 RepID=UPI001BB77D17|nr:DNA-binding protein [Catellatospora sp. IY07-71]BCJ74522.1 hypothetical protein CS0771_40660 [Catellatospora sp. IY07-71]
MTDDDALPRGIGSPATRAFAQAGYTRLAQFPALSAQELLKLHGVGPKAIRVLRETLAARGQTFADERE